MQGTRQQKVVLDHIFLMITIAYYFLLSPVPEIVFIKSVNTPPALLILSTSTRLGNCASATVKMAGAAASFKQVWPFPWKMQGTGEFCLPVFSPESFIIPQLIFIATFLHLANLPSAEGPEQVEKAVPLNIVFPTLKYP